MQDPAEWFSEMSVPSFHLWLMPTGDAYGVLSNEIDTLSAKYSSPRFEPHMTLLSDLKGGEASIVAKCDAVAQRLGPVRILLTKPETSSSYYRCVYMAVERTLVVEQARKAACLAFSRIDTEFEPHVSLLYGDFGEQERIQICRSVTRCGDFEFDASALVLVEANSGEPSDWLVVQKWTLEKNVAA